MVDSVSRPSMPANLGFPELWLPTYYHYPFPLPLSLSLSLSLFVRSLFVASATLFQTTRERVFSSIVLLSGLRVVVRMYVPAEKSRNRYYICLTVEKQLS